MRTTKRTLVAVAFVFAPLAPARAVVTLFGDQTAYLNFAGQQELINFDALAVGALIDQQFQSLGVTFAPFNNGVPRTASNVGIQPQLSPFRMMTTVPGTGGGGGFATTFSPGASSIAFWLGDYENTDPTLVEVFNHSGSLGKFDVSTHVVPGPLQWRFFGLSSTDVITRMEVGIGARDLVIFDNFMFRSVPEPSSVGVLVIGLSCISLAARSKRRIA